MNEEVVENTQADSGTGLEKPNRDLSLDLARGIGIVAVLTIHISNNISRLYCKRFAIDWVILTSLNRLVAFAVPLFFLISSALYTKSLLKDPDQSGLMKFYFSWLKKRLKGLVYPYVLWTIIYWLLNLIFQPSSRGSSPILILGIEVSVPTFFAHVGNRAHDLLWGKGWYHLYFLIVLIQITIVFPIFIEIIRRLERRGLDLKRKFFGIALTGIFCQFGILYLQHNYLKFFFPASTFCWYLIAIFFGVWTGMNNWKSKLSLFQQFLLGFLVVLGGYFYLKEEVNAIRHLPVSNYFSNMGNSIYGASCSILIVFLCRKTIPEPVSKVIMWLGNRSLQIFLVHPVFIELFGSHKLLTFFQKLHLGGFPAVFAILLSSLATVEGIQYLKISKLFFGR